MVIVGQIPRINNGLRDDVSPAPTSSLMGYYVGEDIPNLGGLR